MRHLTFISNRSGLVRQAIATWVILFASTILFATLSTLFYYNGRTREDGILLALITSGLLAAAAQVICYRLDYSYAKLKTLVLPRLKSFPLEVPLGITYCGLAAGIFGKTHLDIVIPFALVILIYHLVNRVGTIRIELEIDHLRRQLKEHSHPVTDLEAHTSDEEDIKKDNLKPPRLRQRGRHPRRPTR